MAPVCPPPGIDFLRLVENEVSPLSISGESGALKSAAHVKGSGVKQPAGLSPRAAAPIHGEHDA